MKTTRCKNLKEVSKALNISLYKVNQLRKKLISKHNAPEYMIHGTNGYKWNLLSFKTVLNN
jgi:hypothetical protein